MRPENAISLLGDSGSRTEDPVMPKKRMSQVAVVCCKPLVVTALSSTRKTQPASLLDLAGAVVFLLVHKGLAILNKKTSFEVHEFYTSSNSVSYNLGTVY